MATLSKQNLVYLSKSRDKTYQWLYLNFHKLTENNKIRVAELFLRKDEADKLDVQVNEVTPEQKAYFIDYLARRAGNNRISAN